MNEDDTLPPLFPLSVKDYVGYTVATVGLIVAAGGGIGGGGILVPCYILVLQFPVKRAIPLASVTVLGGAIANLLLNWSKRHPVNKSRTCIDWDLVSVMEPMTTVGAIVGAVFNRILPAMVLVVLVFLVLVFTAWKTLEKANSLYRKESEALLKQTNDASITSIPRHAETVPLKQNNASYPSSETNQTFYGSSEQSDGRTEEEEESLHVGLPIQKEATDDEWQNKKVLIDSAKICGMCVFISSCNAFTGSGVFKQPSTMALRLGISQSAIIAFVIIFSFHVRSTLLRRLRDGRPVTSDVAWNESNTLTYLYIAALAGVLAGLLGIGGGLVKAPLMLALGVHPVVASATAATMIFFTTWITTTSFMVFGMLVYDYAAFCFVIGFVSTVVGQILMDHLLKKYRRNSYIAYCIGYVVGISAICIVLQSIIVGLHH